MIGKIIMSQEGNSMKSKVLSAILAIVMIVSGVPTAGISANAPSHTVAVLLEPTSEFYQIGSFNNGLAAVSIGEDYNEWGWFDNVRWGFINTRGEVVVPICRLVQRRFSTG
jgi:hypothetical protein